MTDISTIGPKEVNDNSTHTIVTTDDVSAFLSRQMWTQKLLVNSIHFGVV